MKNCDRYRFGINYHSDVLVQYLHAPVVFNTTQQTTTGEGVLLITQKLMTSYSMLHVPYENKGKHREQISIERQAFHDNANVTILNLQRTCFQFCFLGNCRNRIWSLFIGWNTETTSQSNVPTSAFSFYLQTSILLGTWHVVSISSERCIFQKYLKEWVSIYHISQLNCRFTLCSV